MFTQKKSQFKDKLFDKFNGPIEMLNIVYSQNSFLIKKKRGTKVNFERMKEFPES